MLFLRPVFVTLLSLLVLSPSPQLPNYGQYVRDWTPLHRNISQLERVQVIREVPISEVYSAPGHLNLRSPEAVEAIARAMVDGTFSSNEQMLLNIVTNDEGIRYIEFPDGNHRAAAMLKAFPESLVGDVPEVRVLVNGFDTNGARNARWIPLDIAKEAGIPHVDVSSSPFAKGPTAQVDPGVDFSTLPDKIRGAPMRDVLARTEARLAEIKLAKSKCVTTNSAFLTLGDVAAPIALKDQLQGNIRAAKNEGYPVGASGAMGLLRTADQLRQGFVETFNVVAGTPVYSAIDFIPSMIGYETAIPKEYSIWRGESKLEQWWNEAGGDVDPVLQGDFTLKRPADGWY
jgi:hypothetical protein